MRVPALRAGAAVAILATLAACDERPEPMAMTAAGGDVERGRQAIDRHGCGACHTIPGISQADATVGPPLTATAHQVYVAGVLPNLPDQLVRWIVDPPSVDPRTAMPNVGVSEAEARDIAAYLYAVGR